MQQRRVYIHIQHWKQSIKEYSATKKLIKMKRSKQVDQINRSGIFEWCGVVSVR